MKEKYYITTAITYTSGKPHIGNTYEIVLADAIARYKRQQGYDVYFQTGTDEHGQKIENKAIAVNKEPQVFVDEIAAQVQSIWDLMNTSYDAFVRTTNPQHKKVVQKIFRKLYEQGDIYKGKYEGNYCQPCESFFTDSQLIDGKCPDCGREVTIASEEAYFLKITKYADQLTNYVDSHPDFIQPISRKNEIVNNFIKPGLQDLCVSRTSFKWGIPVDFDTNHIVYVWIDALSNYITFLGYDPDGSSDSYSKYWPADLQLIGKDILRFHAIYWPILLMALGEPLPKQIFAHPWVLFGNDKMSKSKGNILYADDLVNKYGVDAVRYYLLHEIPYASDGSITVDLLIERINSDLANVLGNLVNRTLAMAHKYFNGAIPNPSNYDSVDQELIDYALNTPHRIEDRMQDLHVADAIDEIFEIFRRANKYIDVTAPWSLAKEETNTERLKTVIYVLLESIRQGAILLEPFMPETSIRILQQLNTENNNINEFNGLKVNEQLNNPEPLFKRIDKEEKNV